MPTFVNDRFSFAALGKVGDNLYFMDAEGNQAGSLANSIASFEAQPSFNAEAINELILKARNQDQAWNELGHLAFRYNGINRQGIN